MSIWKAIGKGISSVASWVPIVGDAINAVGNIGSSLINSHSQKETNKANARINDANNAFNAEQSQLQRDWSAAEADKARSFDTSEREAQQSWQESMIRMQNEWNSPINQLKLMQEAGLNPASFDGIVSSSASPSGVPSGSSVGVPSGSAAHAASAIPMQAPRYDFDIAAARLMNAQATKLNTDTDSEKIRQKYLDALYQGDVDEQNTRIHVNLQNERLSRRDEDRLIEETKYLRQQQAALNVTMLNVEAQTKGLTEDAIYKHFLNENAVEDLAKRFKQMDAQTRKLICEGDNYEATAKYWLNEAAKATTENKLLQFEVWKNRQTGFSQVRAIRVNAAAATYDFNWNKQHKTTLSFFNAGSQALGAMNQTVGNFILGYGVLKNGKSSTPSNPTIPGTGVPNLNPSGFSTPSGLNLSY